MTEQGTGKELGLVCLCDACNPAPLPGARVLAPWWRRLMSWLACEGRPDRPLEPAPAASVVEVAPG